MLPCTIQGPIFPKLLRLYYLAMFTVRVPKTCRKMLKNPGNNECHTVAIWERGIADRNSVILSLCPTVREKNGHCEKTKESAIDILMSYRRF